MAEYREEIFTSPFEEASIARDTECHFSRKDWNILEFQETQEVWISCGVQDNLLFGCFIRNRAGGIGGYSTHKTSEKPREIISKMIYTLIKNAWTYVSTGTDSDLPSGTKLTVLAWPPGRESASYKWTSWSLCSLRSHVAARPETPEPTTATFI